MPAERPLRYRLDAESDLISVALRSFDKRRLAVLASADVAFLGMASVSMFERRAIAPFATAALRRFPPAKA
jgi:hypothetical protein